MTAPSKYIMIVEDEMMIALHIEDTLTQFGHRVITATTKAEAQRLLDTGDVDLAIVDYMVTDGTTETLMQSLQKAGVPFIVCSGISEEQDVRQRNGHTSFLSMPFSSDSLVDAVSALLGGGRAGRGRGGGAGGGRPGRRAEVG